MKKVKERVSVPVSLPSGLVEELDYLVEKKIFGSRSEALRYGAHLVVLFQNRLHSKAEEYGYQETKSRLKRGKSVS